MSRTLKINRVGRAWDNKNYMEPNYVFVTVMVDGVEKLVVSTEYRDKQEGGMYWLCTWVHQQIIRNADSLDFFDMTWLDRYEYVMTGSVDPEAIRKSQEERGL
ncbi:hypothetical protein VPHD479_0310 [Vibrio phage D479]